MTSKDDNSISRRDFIGDMTVLGASALTLAAAAAPQEAIAAEAAKAAPTLLSPFTDVSGYDHH